MEDLNLLVLKAKKKDKEAFGQLYKIYAKKLYRYCFINLTNKDIAMDIVQETFLKTWNSLPTFSLENGGSIQAFLFRVARNLMIDLSRKKREYPLDEALEMESNSDLEAEIDKKAAVFNLKEALSKLDEEDRQIILLRYFEELTPTEAAKIIGINEGTLRVRCYRILKKLKGYLQ